MSSPGVGEESSSQGLGGHHLLMFRVNHSCRLASVISPVHLLGLDALLGSVGAVAGDVKLQDDGVMDHPINRRRGGHGVGEDAFPLRVDQV